MKNNNIPPTQSNVIYEGYLKKLTIKFFQRGISWIFWIIGIISTFYVILASFHSGTRLILPLDTLVNTNLEVLNEQMKLMSEYYKKTGDFGFQNFTNDLNFCYSNPSSNILFYSHHRTYKDNFPKDSKEFSNRIMKNYRDSTITHAYSGVVNSFQEILLFMDLSFDSLNSSDTLLFPFKNELIKVHKEINREFLAKFDSLRIEDSIIQSQEELLNNIVNQTMSKIPKKIYQLWMTAFRRHSQHKTLPCFLIFLEITKSYLQLQINYILEKKPLLIRILTHHWFHYFFPIMFDEMANIQFKLNKIEIPLLHYNYLEFNISIIMLGLIRNDLEKVKIRTIKD